MTATLHHMAHLAEEGHSGEGLDDDESLVDPLTMSRGDRLAIDAATKLAHAWRSLELHRLIRRSRRDMRLEIADVCVELEGLCTAVPNLFVRAFVEGRFGAPLLGLEATTSAAGRGEHAPMWRRTMSLDGCHSVPLVLCIEIRHNDGTDQCVLLARRRVRLMEMNGVKKIQPMEVSLGLDVGTAVLSFS